MVPATPSQKLLRSGEVLDIYRTHRSQPIRHNVMTAWPLGTRADVFRLMVQPEHR